MAPGSMICPGCGKLINVDAERCPYCGAWRPGMFGLAQRLRRLFGGRFDLDVVVITVCVALYVLALALQPEAIFRPRGLFAILSPGTRALYQLGMTSGDAWRLGWWWTLLTAIYLHGGVLHILFNMLWVRQLGPSVTAVYGPGRSFVIFSLSGACGFLLSNLTSGAPTVGASGSIFGLLAALIVYGRRRRISMLSAQLWQWAVILFVFGFVMPNVNNWGHFGGFVGGWVTASLMKFDDEHRETPFVQLTALALLALTVAGVVLSFLSTQRALAGG